MTDEEKRKIDAMTYSDLMHRWRCGPLGDLFWQGECGKYAAARMKDLRAEPGGDEMHTAASKEIGW